ncbi:MAG: hypothetical protein WAX69_26080 [Victivallales bacterium]
MITLRTDKRLEEILENTAKAKGMTKSEIVRQSLALYLSANARENPYKLGEKIFGAYGSGKGNLSEDSEKMLKIKFKKPSGKNTDAFNEGGN